MFLSRIYNHQLLNPAFDNPVELVSRMGVLQAQDLHLAKWAIGIRLKNATIKAIDDSLARGEIIRTHLLRPTWHFVTAEDFPWMLKLSGERIRKANDSYAKKLGFTEEVYYKGRAQIEKMLENNMHMTRQEIGERLNKEGVLPDISGVNYFLIRAEAEGVLCSGKEKEKKHTYALIHERIGAVKRELLKEEALAELATRYFKSHGPATLQDFIWWSGLTVGDAKKAIAGIQSELFMEKYEENNFYFHVSSERKESLPEDTIHFLPPYDEYLISYKDRSMVLSPEFYRKAFTSYGIFYPVIMYNGRIVGNWKKVTKKNEIYIETSFFENIPAGKEKKIKEAAEQYVTFMKG